jgi:hypothetical protein
VVHGRFIGFFCWDIVRILIWGIDLGYSPLVSSNIAIWLDNPEVNGGLVRENHPELGNLPAIHL